MTEREWTVATNVDEMVRTIGRRRTVPRTVKERKLRLAAIAFARLWPNAAAAPDLMMVLEVAERYGDGLIEWGQALEATHAAAAPGHHVSMIVLAKNPKEAPAAVAGSIRWGCNPNGDGPLPATHPSIKPQPGILRDIFGNPFRSVAFDPAWRTSAAVSLAQSIYDGRDFAAMPVLADALQDAGCEHADVLDHSRDPQQVHVRGCWVVDLVLGKS